MQIGIIGANFKTTNIQLREKIEQACRVFFPRISPFEKKSYIPLFTCNRCEIYFSGGNLSKVHEFFLGLLRKEIQEEFEPYLYSFFGEDAFVHLAKVTAGLDSAILGESEIQGQVKRAYTDYANEHDLSSALHYLFQKSLQLGKYIRNQALFFPKVPSLSYEIDRLISALMPHRQPSIFFLGNSKINQNLIWFLRNRGIKKMALCSRFPINTDSTDMQQIIPLPWDAKKCWRQYDVVIAAARNASRAIAEFPQESLQTRVLFDLGIPRNISHTFAKNPQLHFYNLENIEKLFEKNHQRYLNNIQICESEIKRRIGRYAAMFQQKLLQLPEECLFRTRRDRGL